MLNQISIYKNKIPFANVPVQKGKPIYPVTQVPRETLQGIYDFVNGKSAVQRHEQWSWEWQQAPIMD